jgi:hypothetical protein
MYEPVQLGKKYSSFQKDHRRIERPKVCGPSGAAAETEKTRRELEI